MAKFKSEDLLNELTNDVHNLVAAAEHLKGSDKGKLIYQIDKKQWSIVQILEHLNAYGRYYLPIIEQELTSASSDTKEAWFTSGYWGEMFVKKMKPANIYEVKNKMKAMKSFSFPNSLNVETVLTEYLEQKQKLLQLLNLAKDRNLNNIRIPITISKFIRLKLGDVFRFLIAHEQRHMIQARNTLKGTGISTERFPVIFSTSGAATV
jgi:hypothetical protein